MSHSEYCGLAVRARITGETFAVSFRKSHSGGQQDTRIPHLSDLQPAVDFHGGADGGALVERPSPEGQCSGGHGNELSRTWMVLE